MRLFKIHPLLKLVNSYVVDSPQPSNLSYWWNFGSLLAFSLIIQIVTGVTLAMHYNTDILEAFNSVEHIMRDVNNGWLIRYLHSNTASAFFFIVYLHIGRGLYYGSYKTPRTLVWTIGTVIFISMIGTAFLGYVLPFGQMSLWGATVITSLMSAIPWVGQDIVEFIWGGFSVNHATLNRFFALHFVLPFLLAALALMHLITLHDRAGSGNPLGLSGNPDRLPFAPYYIFKDLITIFIFILVLSIFVFYMPNILGDSENYVMANPMQTPPAIVPEWYLLPFYAILRSIPNKLLGVIAMFSAILMLLVMPFVDMTSSRGIQFKPLNKIIFFLFVGNFLALTQLGAEHVESPFIEYGQISTILYFAYFLIIIPSICLFENGLTELWLEKDLSKKTQDGIEDSNNEEVEFIVPQYALVQSNLFGGYNLSNKIKHYSNSSKTRSFHTSSLLNSPKDVSKDETKDVSMANQDVYPRAPTDPLLKEYQEKLEAALIVNDDSDEIINEYNFHKEAVKRERVREQAQEERPELEQAQKERLEQAQKERPEQEASEEHLEQEAAEERPEQEAAEHTEKKNVKDDFDVDWFVDTEHLKEVNALANKTEKMITVIKKNCEESLIGQYMNEMRERPWDDAARDTTEMSDYTQEEVETKQRKDAPDKLDDANEYSHRMMDKLKESSDKLYEKTAAEFKIYKMKKISWGETEVPKASETSEGVVIPEASKTEAAEASKAPDVAKTSEVEERLKELDELNVPNRIQASDASKTKGGEHSHTNKEDTSPLPESNCDAPRPWGIYFQENGTPQTEALLELHDNIVFYLIIILVGVAWSLVTIINAIVNKSSDYNKEQLEFIVPSYLIKQSFININPDYILDTTDPTLNDHRGNPNSQYYHGNGNGNGNDNDNDNDNDNNHPSHFNLNNLNDTDRQRAEKIIEEAKEELEITDLNPQQFMNEFGEDLLNAQAPPSLVQSGKELATIVKPDAVKTAPVESEPSISKKDNDNESILPTSECDAPRPWGIYFQDSATPQMEALVELHDNIVFYLIIILFGVAWLLVTIVNKFGGMASPLSQRFSSHGTTIEIIWTVTPGIILILIAFPSFKLLYLMDEITDPIFAIFAEGHQWYWSYQYVDFLNEDYESLEYDSYLIPEADLEDGALRMLEVDNRLIVPELTHIRFVVQGGDVIHSFACPALGLKCDAYPGRLNQSSFMISRAGTFYGQCSEICGILHSSMPTVIEAVSSEKFVKWLLQQ